MSHVKKLYAQELINPPPFVVEHVQYETIMGSEAYGVSSNSSDRDVYGFCIPPRDVVFPHTAGHIPGFGKKPTPFNQWEQHHIAVPGEVVDGEPREYDFSIYSIVRYFQLCLENNPNMIDSLFTPQRCVLFETPIAKRVREKRCIFLQTGSYYKFSGYAASQLKKIRSKETVQFVQLCRELNLDPMTLTTAHLEAMMTVNGQWPWPHEAEYKQLFGLLRTAEKRGGWGKRLERVAEHGYDTKFAYHVVRLMDECDQILRYGDIDLTRDRERLKAIRNGEWPLDRLEAHFAGADKAMRELYTDNPVGLPEHADQNEAAVKALLLECLEEHWGSLGGVVEQSDRLVQALREVRDVVDKVRGQL